MLTMKKLLYIFTLLLGLTACDVIPEADRLIPVEIQTAERGVLLIDFSGMRCVNCPTAAEQAEHLLEAYGDNLVVVEMDPPSNSLTKPNLAMNDDYRCAEADYYYTLFGGNSTTSLPTGVIDFQAIDSKYLTDYTNWGARIADRIAQKPIVKTHFTTHVYDTMLDVQGELSILPDSLLPADQQERDVLLHLWIVEGEVVGKQLLPDGSVDTAYERHHLFRGALNAPEGEPLHLTTSSYPYVHKGYSFPQTVDRATSCTLVVVLRDATTGEVLHATQEALYSKK